MFVVHLIMVEKSSFVSVKYYEHPCNHIKKISVDTEVDLNECKISGKFS